MNRFLKLGVMSGLALAATASFAQAPNDNGTPVNPAPSSIIGPFLPSGGPVCPDGPVTSEFTGANTQLGRIFRDGVASTCPNKVYPGIFNDSTTYNYEAFTFSNTDAGAACVTVNFDPDAGATPCGTNAHASAYLNSYDPANQGTNFLGDVGSSIAQPFSFEVPGNSDLVLVVTNTASQATCTFGFEVVDLPCTAGVPLAPARELPAGNTLSWLAMGLALLGLGWFAARRRAR